MAHPKIEAAIKQGELAAQEYIKTKEPNRNPYRDEAIERGWYDHGFRMELKRQGIIK